MFFFIDWSQVKLIATLRDHPAFVRLGTYDDFPGIEALNNEAGRFGLTILMTGGAVLAKCKGPLFSEK